MGRPLHLILGAWSALLVLAAVAQEAPDCVNTCASQMRAEFSKLSCSSANDAACLCANHDFFYGVRDCGTHCGANNDNVRKHLEASFCTGILSSSAPSSPAASTPPPTPSSASGTPVSTPALPSSTSSTPTTTSEPTSATAAATSKASTSTSSKVATQTSSAAAGAKTSSAAAAADPPAQSQASLIGIGFGVGAAVIALAGVVICCLLKSRKRGSHQSMEISKPLPGSGRTYAGRENNSFEKYGNDIEMTTNRYEDMVPRQQPRTMV